jgi:hypothetical protein
VVVVYLEVVEALDEADTVLPGARIEVAFEDEAGVVMRRTDNVSQWTYRR